MAEPMLIVEQAQDRVLSAFHPLEAERIDLLTALGRVLAEDVFAGEDIPPHTNSSMDGYAVMATDTDGASPGHPVRLRIVGKAAAGYVPETDIVSGTALRIMTGAPLPPGADAVVKVEDTEFRGEWVAIHAQVLPNNYVRPSGEDVRQGECVMHKGTRLRPQEIGMLATLGHKTISVYRQPRVAILATGDELIEIDQPLTPGKIRNANSYSNAAQVLAHGGEPVLLGIARDKTDDLVHKIRNGLAQNIDLFLTSGGVSVGDFDLVKDVLASEGDIAFWRVRMKPGKPLAFGHIDNVPVLGLPGNPVSVMVSFEMFVRPALWKMQGRAQLMRPTLQGILEDAIERKDQRRHYVRVHVKERGGVLHAHLTGGQGSGILSSLVKANALAIIPEEWDHAPAGAHVDIILLD
jgi:molybdopterin molybdotransferase